MIRPAASGDEPVNRDIQVSAARSLFSKKLNDANLASRGVFFMTFSISDGLRSYRSSARRLQGRRADETDIQVHFSCSPYRACRFCIRHRTTKGRKLRFY